MRRKGVPLSPLKGFQKVISSYILANRVENTDTFSAAFAVSRFWKKLEIPDASRSAARKKACWDNWQAYDYALYDLKIGAMPVARARTAHFQFSRGVEFKQYFGDEIFTNGSTYVATRGKNSLEEKLQNLEWTITEDCIPLFAELTLRNRALKTGLKERCRRCYGSLKAYRRVANAAWREAPSGLNQYKRALYVIMVHVRNVVPVVLGSRFSTVPKNNEKDRPINLEPFCNILVQRSIGIGLRNYIRDCYGVDLLNAQEVHGRLISECGKATLDLSNASDSITPQLVKLVVPKTVYDLTMASRSPYVEQSSGDIHFLNKISSMGNGFTFELMTLLLLAITRYWDNKSRVYGDDIIVNDTVAANVISDLTAVGFQINVDKSFYGDNPFRESCGKNFHRTEGYIWSFDFHYPVNEVDCIVFFNKLLYLQKHYGLFNDLVDKLSRLVPVALRCNRFELATDPLSNVPLDDFFHLVARKRNSPGNFKQRSSDLCYKDFHVFKTFVSKSRRVNSTDLDMTADQYGKYYMYLHAGRVTDNVYTGTSKVSLVALIQHDENPYALRTSGL